MLRRFFPRRRLAAALVLAGVGLTACDLDSGTTVGPVPQTATIAQIAASNTRLSTLVTALGAANLVNTLNGDGPFTVFAPVNEAFAALPQAQLDALLASGNAAILSKVLTYHVVPGRINASQLTNGQTLTTVEGTTITVSLAGGARVNNARVIATDIEASNGVIHLIDGVLLGSLDIVDVATVRGFTTLAGAVQAAGLTSALRGNGTGTGLTVFAPTNAAFAALSALPSGQALIDALSFHVVPGTARAANLSNGQRLTTLEGNTLRVNIGGGTVRLETSTGSVTVTATDVPAKNGVIHVIDAVMLPPANNIVQLASATSDLSTLTAAVTAGQLATTLAGPGPFTVFAPVNSAFAALPSAVLNRLLDSGNLAILQKVLRYHVVPGRIFASDLRDGQTVTTVEGTTLRVSLTGGARVNDANIVATDIQAKNGVVHLIDGVLTESLDIVDVATINGFAQLVGAVQAAGLTNALRGNGTGTGLTVFAPTDAAFGALPAVPSGQALTDVLTYHVVPTTALSTSLTDGQVVPTLLAGRTLEIDLTGGVRVIGATNTVNVTVTDVRAKNGVIHVIDAVLIP
jgi:uncharacterized surface protein with fasciclin (FAS1) repeats